jgi:FeS assembly SUF system regulator
MIKISKLSDYAIVVLNELARAQGQLLTATMLSHSTRIPEPTVAKVLKLLSKQKIVNSIRGVNGGYMMKRCPSTITVHELIVALEGPVALTACTTHSNDTCNIEQLCPLRSGWQKINDAITGTLDGMYLNDLFLNPVDKQYNQRGVQ